MKKLLKKVYVLIFLIVSATAAVFMTITATNAKIGEFSSHITDLIKEKYNLTVKVSGEDISFFPPRISFGKISVSDSEGETAEMEQCFVYDIANLMFSKEKTIKAKCGKSRFRADKIVKVLPIAATGGGKKQFSGKNISNTGGKSLNNNKSLLFETEADFILGNLSQKFSLSFTFANKSGRISLMENGGENGGRAEIIFSAASKNANIRLDGINLGRYRELIKSRTPLEISDGKIDAHFDIEPDENGNFLCKTDLSVKNIAFFHPVIDSRPFKIPLFRFSGDITADKNEKLVSTKGADLSLGGINAKFSGSYSRHSKDFSIKTDSVSLNKLETLIHDETFENYLFGGTLELFVEYSEKEGETPLFSVSGNLSEPKQLSDRMDYLKYGFDYTVTNENGSKKTIFVGERNPNFTPIEFIPQHLVWAVVVSEDAGFFVHKGIDFQELDAAVKDNIKKHRMRGGSTIPQQLAKNLFLSREKTLLRKFREVLLSIELDATLSKERMLEIYLNIIEWAPGVSGITRAADYYFGKTPAELTPLESAYLASVIPGPSKYHYQFLTKNISENWYRNLYRILNIMNETGHLSLEEYIEATRQTINFRGNTESE